MEGVHRRHRSVTSGHPGQKACAAVVGMYDICSFEGDGCSAGTGDVELVSQRDQVRRQASCAGDRADLLGTDHNFDLVSQLRNFHGQIDHVHGRSCETERRDVNYLHSCLPTVAEVTHRQVIIAPSSHKGAKYC
jgi:hypothetical protein